MARDAIKWPMTETMIKDLTKDSLYERLFRSQYGGYQWHTAITRRIAMKDSNVVAQFKVDDRVVVVKDDRYSGRKKGDMGTVAAGYPACGISYNYYYEVAWDSGGANTMYDEFLGPASATAKGFALGDHVKLPNGELSTVGGTTAGGAVLVNGGYYDPARLTPVPKDAFTGTLPKTAGEMLDAIDQFLSVGDDKAADVAAVLTALRGPDGDNLAEKLNTTIPVRCAALPKTAARRGDPWIRVGKNGGMSFASAGFRYQAPADHTHFGAHIVEAVGALKRMGREVK